MQMQFDIDILYESNSVITVLHKKCASAV